ncbi:MAG: hypothetical protein HUU16_01075 [Candidatus Omnitrophica bacterium]|nr:hypothetical protein [Candidatus Omnitrophota bacterium]
MGGILKFQGRWRILAAPLLGCLPHLVFAGSISLDGDWRIHPIRPEIASRFSDTQLVERYSAADLPDASWTVIKVPGYWDTPSEDSPWMDPSRSPALFPGHNGEAWLRAHFQVPETLFPEGGATDALKQSLVGVLRFEAVSARASVWLNGTFVGKHLGAFDPFELEFAASLLTGGDNVLAVRVADKSVLKRSAGGEKGNLASEIPLGLETEAGGIYRSVSLAIHSKERILDVFVNPKLQSLSLDVSVSEAAIGNSTLEMLIEEKATGKVVHGPRKEKVQFDSRKYRHQTFSIPNLPGVKAWSPETPNLHRLTLKLLVGAREADSRVVDFGFRTFQSGRGVFLLNGRRYFLFGAGSPPHEENVSDELARAHLTALKEAGVRAVRFANEPPSSKWLSLCDELGLLAWVEGPLLAHEGPYNFSRADFVNQAATELLEAARSLRNHPSLVVWSNGASNQTVITRKNVDAYEVAGKVLSDLAGRIHKSVFGLGRIAIPESDNRGAGSPLIEDWHAHDGWYSGRIADWGVFLQQLSIYREGIAGGTAPWVCSELSAGFSSDGQGQVLTDPREEAASRMRIGAPGDDASALMEYQSNRIERFIEEARALRNPASNRIAGIFPYSCANWFFNPLTDGASVPKPILAAVRRAYRPVVVAARSLRAHYYSGEILDATLTVANDDIRSGTVGAGLLICEVFGPGDQTSPAARGEVPIGAVPYYTSLSRSIPLRLPDIEGLQTAKVRVRLVSGANEIVTTDRSIRIASHAFADPIPKDVADGLALHDVKGTLAELLKTHKIEIPAFNDLGQLKSTEEQKPISGLIVGPGSFDSYIDRAWPSLRVWVEAGGRMLVLDQDPPRGRWEYSGPLPGGRSLLRPTGWPTGIDRVNPRLAEHPLFDGVRREDLAEWGADGVVATTVCQPGDDTSGKPRSTVLADVVPDSDTFSWKEVVTEIEQGEGRILLCQLKLVEKAALDPVASRILKNALVWVGGARRPVLANYPPNEIPFLAPFVATDRVYAEESGTSPHEPILAIKDTGCDYTVEATTDQSGVTFTGIIPNPKTPQVYYDIDDRFWGKKSGPAEIQVQVYGKTPSEIRLDYDSSDSDLLSESAYKKTAPRPLLEVNAWKILVFSVPDARFENRQFGNCDFRLTVSQGEAVFGPIEVRKGGATP